jgi:DNA-binding GntR family transcriptional regulator
MRSTPITHTGVVGGPGQHSAEMARSLYSGRIAGELRRAIIGGELPAGTPLVESRLAHQLEVSRGPIRSALHALEGEGLVRTQANGRTLVTGFGRGDITDLFRTRLELESCGVRWGIERGGDLAPVGQAFEELGSEGATTPRLVELDVLFHRALVAFSGSRFLVQSWLAIAPVIQAVISLGNARLAVQDPASNVARIVDSHRDLWSALLARDADAATRMLEAQFAITTSMFDGAIGAGETA